MTYLDAHEITDAELRLEAALAEAPIIAILRGLRTEEAIEIVQALYSAGIRVAEVPLNSPNPFETITLLVQNFGKDMIIGAGTVTTLDQVAKLVGCGAQICVSPNTDPTIIAEALRFGIVPIPGFETATEAFQALDAGARYLKFYPATGRNAELKAIMAVLPREVHVTAVGGVTPRDVLSMFDAGAKAFGVGADVYQPGVLPPAVQLRAMTWIAACKTGAKRVDVCLAVNPRAMIGESIQWRSAGGGLVWVDPIARELHIAEATGVLQALPMGEAVYGLATMPSGQLVGTLENGMCVIDEVSGRVTRRSSVPLSPGCRFNDLCIDPDGGLWIGVMHTGLLATRGSLYYASSINATPIEVACGLGIPNGMVFDALGSQLFVIDTQTRTLLSYPVNLQDGWVGEPRVITDFMGISGKPDGMARAVDGSFWVAMWGGGCVVQINTQGALIQTVNIPAPHVSSVCIAQDNRLWVSTSRMRLSDQQLANAPSSGGVFVVTL
jgi:Entner-Doudoroff aldolase